MLTPRTMLALFSALVFIIIGSPWTYQLTNDLIGSPILRTNFIQNGAPTRAGLLVHALVVFGLTYAYAK